MVNYPWSAYLLPSPNNSYNTPLFSEKELVKPTISSISCISDDVCLEFCCVASLSSLPSHIYWVWEAVDHFPPETCAFAVRRKGHALMRAWMSPVVASSCLVPHTREKMETHWSILLSGCVIPGPWSTYMSPCYCTFRCWNGVGGWSKSPCRGQEACWISAIW